MGESRDVEIDFARARRAIVKVDGKEVRGVTRVIIELGVEEVSKVHIDCIGMDGYVKLEETDVTIEPHVGVVDGSETA